MNHELGTQNKRNSVGFQYNNNGDELTADELIKHPKMQRSSSMPIYRSMERADSSVSPVKEASKNNFQKPVFKLNKNIKQIKPIDFSTNSYEILKRRIIKDKLGNLDQSLMNRPKTSFSKKTLYLFA